MPNLECEGSRLEGLRLDDWTRAYVMFNGSLEKLLFDRSMVGLEFTATCRAATRAFLRHMEPEIADAGGDIAELVLLSKGLYYGVGRAFEEVFGRNLETNFIATKRVLVEGSSVSIEVPYCDLSAPARCVIVADTIASGSTMCTAIERYMEVQTIDRLLVFSAAGSGVGGRALARMCREKGIDVSLVYGLAAFGLGANGFDLSFLHPDTVCPKPEYVEWAREAFHGRPVSSVGWDFGSQAQSVRKYKMLCWLEEEYWGLQGSGVFQLKEKPGDWRLVEKERAAFAPRTT